MNDEHVICNEHTIAVRVQSNHSQNVTDIRNTLPQMNRVVVILMQA